MMVTEQRTLRLLVSSISKSFPGVQALSNVSLELAPGEIHALVGENGAGKSTFTKIVAGAESADTGTVHLDGVDITGADEHTAATAGVGVVYQEGSLITGLSVAEAMHVGHTPTNKGMLDFRRMRDQARTHLEELGLDLDPRTTLRDIPFAERQMVEIAKALTQNVKLLILDEPTAALTLKETEKLFEVVERLSLQGVATLYISHRLAEVFEIAHRVTVLKDGRLVATEDVSTVDTDDLIRLMVGRTLSFDSDSRRVDAGSEILLDVKGLRSEPSVRRADITVRAGEIVCLSGLIGAGRSEFGQAIFGSRSAVADRASVGGLSGLPRSPSEAIDRGVIMIPEDRKTSGLFLDMDVVSNIVASSLDRVTRRGLIDRKNALSRARNFIDRFHIATPSARQALRNLSGGNQQKVMLGKGLAAEPRLLIVDEPTRGVDVGARSEIYELMRELSTAGFGLLVISSDMAEILTLAHRIVVMTEGLTVGELDAEAATEEKLLRMASPPDRGEELIA